MVKAIARFKDKKTGKVHEIGEKFRVSKARYKEILEVGEFVEPVEEDEEPEA